MSTLRIHDFATRILKRALIILAVGIIGAILAWQLQARSTPSYRAKASFVVGPPKSAEVGSFTTNDAALNRQLVETYVDLSESYIVSKVVSEQLGIAQPAIDRAYDAYQRSDSLVIQATADYSDPDTAIAIVNKSVEVTLEEAPKIMKIDHLTQVDVAQTAELRSPSRRYALVLGALAGMLLTMLVVSFVPTKAERELATARTQKKDLLSQKIQKKTDNHQSES